MTESPILPPTTIIGRGFGVTWLLKKGYPISSTGFRLQRGTNNWPILPSFDDEEEEETLSPFHETYEWNSVNISYDYSEETEKKPLIGFQITASVFEYVVEQTQETDTTAGADSISYVTDTIIVGLPDVICNSMTISSSNPNGNKPWIFDDDYPDITADPNHPKEYGGVILRNGKTGIVKKMNCGIEDGPDNDGKVYWTTTGGSNQMNISGYNYPDVFDQSDFAYVPFNSNIAVKVERNDRFRLSPKFPAITDPEGLPAPIYPMNAVTTFLPDRRDAVDVTYKVNLSVSDAQTGLPIALRNSAVTINQTCTQETGNYGEQLDTLLSNCNWFNPGNHDTMSPYYPYDYPYTYINGYFGMGFDDVPKDPKRGDIWYNPSTGERKYYSISDIPEELEVVEGGKKYRDKEEVPCVWCPPEKCSQREINEREVIPYGLLVDIKTEKGEIVSVAISDRAQPAGFEDGDEVVVTGGNGNAKLKINIKQPEQWVYYYIDQYV